MEGEGLMATTGSKTRKELEVVQSDFGMKKIQFKGGGQLPKELCGSYTSTGDAQKRIDIYIANRG